MSKIVKHIKKEVAKASTYDKDKSKKMGEVFTPPNLIKEMLSSLPDEAYTDPNKTFYDPCCGKGNFPVFIIQALMKGLKDEFSNEKERYRHIIETQLYMAEYQRESAEFVNELLGMGVFKVNIYVGDTLNMPDDFFDLSYEERKEKYPENTI